MLNAQKVLFFKKQIMLIVSLNIKILPLQLPTEFSKTKSLCLLLLYFIGFIELRMRVMHDTGIKAIYSQFLKHYFLYIRDFHATNH